MKTNYKIVSLFYAILLLLISGCLEDLVPPPFTGELDGTAKLLMYFESSGDFANSTSAPPLVSAEEVHNNIDNYKILDLRTNDVFIQGHIKNSVNISSNNLYSFVEQLIDSGYTKIVLVSKNGQASAYFASLLRLAGFNKVHSLKFGMASWHQDFADEWLDALNDDPMLQSYLNQEFAKNNFTDFPPLSADEISMPVEEIIKNRIKTLLSNGYHSNDVYISTLPVKTGSNYIICYGNRSLYIAPKLMGETGHPPGTTYYRDSPNFDFRSINYLQTLPTDKDIIIYSYNGQLSSSIVAYLKILGYDATSLLFGAHQLFYTRMSSDPMLIGHAFSGSEIMNYNYIRGEINK